MFKENFISGELIPATITIRTFPENIIKEDEALFEHELIKNIKPVKSIIINNIQFTGWGTVVVPKTKALPAELEYPTTTILKQTVGLYYYNLLKTALKGNLLLFSKPVLFILENSSRGYFHWVTDVLPRLTAAKDFKNLAVILPQIFRDVEFIQSSLNALGFKVLFLKEQQNVILKKMNFITHFANSGNYNDTVINKLRSDLQNAYKIIPKAEDRIYISRGKSEKRKIVNEDIVWAYLETLSFKKVYCEDYSFEQQTKLFSNAKLIVANHGAGLTNMIFMKEQGKILELRYELDKINNCYYTLASALNIKYYYMECKPNRPGENQHTADLIVDINLLKKTLQNLFNN